MRGMHFPSVILQGAAELLVKLAHITGSRTAVLTAETAGPFDDALRRVCDTDSQTLAGQPERLIDSVAIFPVHSVLTGCSSDLKHDDRPLLGGWLRGRKRFSERGESCRRAVEPDRDERPVSRELGM